MHKDGPIVKRLRVPVGGAAAAVVVLAIVIAALSGADAQPTVARLDAPPAAVPVSVSVTDPLAPAQAPKAGTGSGVVSAPVQQNRAASGDGPPGPAAPDGYARVIVDNSSGGSNAQTGSSEMSNGRHDSTGLTRSGGG